MRNRLKGVLKTFSFFFTTFLCFAQMTNAMPVVMTSEVPSSQQETVVVTGRVIDTSGNAIIGASVLEKEASSNGTITDLDGNFSLRVRPGATLVISYMGYLPKEVKASGGRIPTIVLEEDSRQLDEVVVTALGMKRDKKALGYAATELKGDELNTTLINPVSALQGKVAGVQIQGSEGGMFGSSRILIRGVSTIDGGSQQPIYVVDGIILSNDTKSGNADWMDNFQPRDFGNELKNLNPDDFETVTVLKGAAATALYGSRGMNGAIIITTKSGKAGKGIGVTVSQTFGIDAVTGQPKLQNVFGEGIMSGYVDYGNQVNGEYLPFDNYNQHYINRDGKPTLIPNGNYGESYGPAFDGSMIEDYDGQYRPYRANKNNFKDAYSVGFNTNTNIALEGGSEKTQFYTSLSLKHATGTQPNNEFDRFSLLAKVTHNLTRTVKVDVGFNFANSWPKNPLINIGELFINGTWQRNYDPSYSRDKYLSQYGGLANNSYNDQWGNMPGRSLWFTMYENSWAQKETAVRPSVKVEWNIFDWLKWNVEGNYSYYYINFEQKEKGQGYMGDGGWYGMSLDTREKTNANTNFIVQKSFGDWTVSGFLRGEYYQNYRKYMWLNTEGGFIVPNQFFINNSKNKDIGRDGYIADEKKIFSVAFQAGFSWRDQIYLDVTGRNDWSSALVYADGHGNYSYFYPSVNASWIISQTFRKQLPAWVSFAKIRGSWAEVGNDTTPYTINSAYGINSWKNAGGNTFYGLNIPNDIKATNLKPERKRSWEVGIDWRFADYRVGIDAAYYKENTVDQIMWISLPGPSGGGSQLINAGNIQNQGVELALNLVPIKSRDWQWDIDFNWTKNWNKIVSLHENVANWIGLEGYTDYGNFRIASVAKVGESYGTLMSDSQVKLDPKSGLPQLTWQESRRGAYLYRNDSEVVEIGSSTPKFTGGLSTTLRYKDWALNIGLDMRFGGYIASYPSRYGTSYGYTEQALKGQPGYGGMTWTSKYDNMTYNDGIIPEGFIPKGTTIIQPDKSVYVVMAGAGSELGESYRELYEKGVIEPTHASYYTERNNAWSSGVVNDTWVKELNYIALRDVSVSYRLPQSVLNKLRIKKGILTLAGHNLGYLLNNMPSGENPEALAGTRAGEFRIRSFQGVTSNFTFNITVGF
jgi:iron complex outermembrane receptor protein